MARNGCVIFAVDIKSMSAFYQQVLNLDVKQSDTSSVLLVGDTLELIIHAIPPKIAKNITIETPPTVRENTAIKPVFVVFSLSSIRSVSETCGGGLKPEKEVWEFNGARFLDGWDPEGNVLQFKQLIS